jgi:hypothetical protein
MYNFWVVMKLEFRLMWRSWIMWVILPVMLLIGAFCATNNRDTPWQSWTQIHSATFFISLILAFCTGNQINRDRERRLAGIILSTPVRTSSYVLGKSLAGLASALMLAGAGLLSALLVDRFYNVPDAFLIFAPTYYPSLGAWPYLLGWSWFALIAIIIGATFTLACITLTRGQRAVAYIAIVLLWVLPGVLLTQSVPKLLDVTGRAFYPQFSLAPAQPVSRTDPDPVHEFLIQHPSVAGDGPPPADLAPQVMQVSLGQIPTSALPPTELLWNRLFFVGLSLGLVLLTIYGTHAMRRRGW